MIYMSLRCRPVKELKKPVQLTVFDTIKSQKVIEKQRGEQALGQAHSKLIPGHEFESLANTLSARLLTSLAK